MEGVLPLFYKYLENKFTAIVKDNVDNEKECEEFETYYEENIFNPILEKVRIACGTPELPPSVLTAVKASQLKVAINLPDTLKAPCQCCISGHKWKKLPSSKAAEFIVLDKRDSNDPERDARDENIGMLLTKPCAAWVKELHSMAHFFNNLSKELQQAVEQSGSATWEDLLGKMASNKKDMIIKPLVQWTKNASKPAVKLVPKYRDYLQTIVEHLKKDEAK